MLPNPGGKQSKLPMPTALKILSGVRESRVNRYEPIPPDEKVTRPGGMSAGAIAVWNELAPALQAIGLLTVLDVNHFRVYCEAVNSWREAVAALNRDGVLIPGDRGQVKHPACQIVRDQASIMLSYGARFGLSPSDRSNLSVYREPEYNHAERLLS